MIWGALIIAAFFGLIFWAEIHYGKLKKKQILNGVKTIGSTFLAIFLWFFSFSRIGKITLFNTNIVLVAAVLYSLVWLYFLIVQIRKNMYTNEDANNSK